MAELKLRKRRGGLAREFEESNDRIRRYFERGDKLVNEPFVGVRTSDGAEEGLFNIAKTSVPSVAMQRAVEEFLGSLDDKQRKEACFDIDSDAWRRWSNIQNFLMRHGTCIEDMTDEQREKALGIMEATYSPEGYELLVASMKRNGLLGEISGNLDEFGEYLYWVSIFGTPSATEPWGWQIDGHHVNINCFVLGDQVVFTPMFVGSEPEIAEYSATRLLEREENDGLRIMKSLSPELFAKALIRDKIPNDCLASSFMDNLVLEKNEGISYDELDAQQQADLLTLVESFLRRVPAGHAQQQMADFKAHLDATSFAWMGGIEDDDVFYYRVYNPVFMIEFNHISGVVFDRSVPNRNHIHTVVRTPNGNDYGKELLRLHRGA